MIRECLKWPASGSSRIACGRVVRSSECGLDGFEGLVEDGGGFGRAKLTRSHITAHAVCASHSGFERRNDVVDAVDGDCVCCHGPESLPLVGGQAAFCGGELIPALPLPETDQGKARRAGKLGLSDTVGLLEVVPRVRFANKRLKSKNRVSSSADSVSCMGLRPFHGDLAGTKLVKLVFHALGKSALD